METINEVVDNVENELFALESQEVRYDQIGNIVMKKLQNIDPVAYVRFASVYRKFEEVGEFVEQVLMLKKP
jgi:transcriptional repressor NrdR